MTMMKTALLSFLCFLFLMAPAPGARAQHLVPQRGTLLTYKWYSLNGESNLVLRIRTVQPDFSYTWINTNQQGQSDSGVFTVSKADMQNARRVVIGFSQNETHSDTSCSILISKTLCDMIRKDLNKKDSLVHFKVNNSALLDLGNIAYANEDLIVENEMQAQTHSIALGEIIPGPDFNDLNPDKTIIRFLDDPSFPVITYFQAPDGDSQLLLVSVTNVQEK